MIRKTVASLRVKLKQKKKFKIGIFRGKILKVKKVQKHDNLLAILKGTLKKKKKRKVRLAGRNFYTMSMKKLLAFQRHYAFFMLRYAFKVAFPF